MPKFIVKKVYTVECNCDSKEDAIKCAPDCFDANCTPEYIVTRFKSPNKKTDEFEGVGGTESE